MMKSVAGAFVLSALLSSGAFVGGAAANDEKRYTCADDECETRASIGPANKSTGHRTYYYTCDNGGGHQLPESLACKPGAPAVTCQGTRTEGKYLKCFCQSGAFEWRHVDLTAKCDFSS